MTRNPTVEPITTPISPTFSQLSVLQALLWLITPNINKHEPHPPLSPPHPRKPLQFQSIPLCIAQHLTHIPDTILPAAPTKKSQVNWTLVQSDVVLMSSKNSRREKFTKPQKRPTYLRHPYHLIPLLPPYRAPLSTEPNPQCTLRLSEYIPLLHARFLKP